MAQQHCLPQLMGDCVRLLQQCKRRLGSLLKVIARSADTVVDLSRKIGSTRSKRTSLMQKTHALRKPLECLLFPIDSQSQFADAHATKQCSATTGRFSKYPAGPDSVLDIGKRFPTDYVTGNRAPQRDINGICQSLRMADSKLPGLVALIVESGQFLVARAITVIISMMGNAKRGQGIEQGPWRNLRDPVYGVFSGQIFGDIVGWQLWLYLVDFVVDRFNAAAKQEKLK